MPHASSLPFKIRRPFAFAASAALLISLPLKLPRQLHAQSPQHPSSPNASDPAQAFEVATIRPSHLTPGCFSILPPGSSHYTVTCVSLRGLIATAYKLNDHHIDGPSKDLDRLYDINASTGDRPLQQQDVAPLLRTLLEQRFHLKVHATQRPIPGFELGLANGGPKLKQTAATNINEAQGIRAGQASPNFIARGMVQGTAADMQTIAALLTIPAGGPVVDQTGLKGRYDVFLHFAADDEKDSDLPGFFAAVEEQLGLKLKPAKVPTNFLVVDSIDPNPSLD